MSTHAQAAEGNSLGAVKSAVRKPGWQGLVGDAERKGEPCLKADQVR